MNYRPGARQLNHPTPDSYNSPIKAQIQQQFIVSEPRKNKMDEWGKIYGVDHRKQQSLDRFHLPQIKEKTSISIEPKTQNEKQTNNLPNIHPPGSILYEEQKVRTPFVIKKNPKSDSKSQLQLTPQMKPKEGDIKQQQEIPKNRETIYSYAMRTKAGLQTARQAKINQDSPMMNPEILHSLVLKTDQQVLVNGYRAFGVFDGHGLNGHKVSQFIRANLPKNLHKYLSMIDGSYDSGLIKDAIKKTYLQTNSELWNADFDTNLSGSTVVSVVLCGNKLFCANVGDSRAIIGKKTNKWEVVNISVDHKPSLPSERERIIKNGGRIDCQKDLFGNPLGPLRVWLPKIDIPGLAMTRSFGDKVGAQAGVSAEPEIIELELTHEHQILIIASDGVWEYVSDEEALKSVSNYYNKNAVEHASDSLMNVSLQQWKKIFFGRDDITCLVIFFHHNQQH